MHVSIASSKLYGPSIINNGGYMVKHCWLGTEWHEEMYNGTQIRKAETQYRREREREACGTVGVGLGLFNSLSLSFTLYPSTIIKTQHISSTVYSIFKSFQTF